MEDKKEKKRIYRLLIIISVVIPVVLSISYAYFQAIIKGNDAGVTGTSTNKFEINLVTEDNGYINASNLILIKAEDVAEEAQKSYFKVVSGNNKHYVTYTLALSSLTISSNLQVSDFKWQLVKNNQIITSGAFNGVSSNSMNLATNLTINANLTQEYELRIWLEETPQDQLSLMNGTFSGKVSLIADMNQNPVEPMLKDLILAQGGGSTAIEAKGTPDFSVINGTSGLYATEDEYGTSYYYRGEKDLLNNNLIFGGFQWKIIRINGDGSIRIIYNGTEAQFNTNSTMNTTGVSTQINGIYALNLTYRNDAKYIGYMYGGENGIASTQRNGNISTAATYNETSSNAKVQLDNWYQLNIFGKAFESKIVDNLFCNDRQLSSEVGGAATGAGYGTEVTTYYATYQRLNITKTPTLKCGLKNDRFTVSDTSLGNGALTYPVGLISADETSIAGLVYSITNLTNYLNAGQVYWISAPYYMLYTGDATSLFIHNNGYLIYGSVTNSFGLRPVLNLSQEVSVYGDGSATNPFRVI